VLFKRASKCHGVKMLQTDAENDELSRRRAGKNGKNLDFLQKIFRFLVFFSLLGFSVS